jgi:hypothetical protein
MAGLREWPMRFFLVAIMTLCLGGGAALAQTASESLPILLPKVDLLPLRLLPSAAPMERGSQRQSPGRSQSRQNEHDSAIIDCMQMWDSGTHMTKQQWSRTCKRVQTRLENLKVDGIIPKPKTQVR